MRCLLVVLMAFGSVSGTTAQSSTRDWRPEDRTVVGDFSRVNAIAASSERVFIVSPAGVLVWNPQFQRWNGSFDPPDRGSLVRPGGMTSPSFQVAVVDLAALADTLVDLTQDQLLWRDPRSRAWTLGPNLSALVGRLRRFVAEGPVDQVFLWVATDGGLVRFRLNAIRP